MSIISSAYGIDSENPLLNWFGGVGRAILGQNNKYNFTRGYNRINTQVILIDVTWNELMLVAQNVPHLNTVISQGASMFSNAEIKHLDKNGEEVKNSEVLKLLNNPNVLQNMQAFLYDFYVMNGIYNVNFGYKNYGRKKEFRGNDLPSFIWWLPGGLMKINRTANLPFRQNKIEGIIKDYQLSLDPEPYYPDEVLMITEGISSNSIAARTRIEALQLPLSNIMAALKSKNTIITERGLIGFIASDNPKDSDGALPPDDDERERIENQYQKDYNLDNPRGHVTFTKSSIKWVPMTFDMNQLQLPEGLEDDFAMICAAYGHHRMIYPLSHVSPKGMTAGTEIDSGLRWTYQNTMMPLLRKLLNSIAQDFGLSDNGEKLVGNYDWMACMKNDELAEGQAELADAQADQAGIQMIINMNTAVKSGTLTREAAIKYLILENDYEEADANILIIQEPTAEEIAAQNAPKPALAA